MPISCKRSCRGGGGSSNRMTDALLTDSDRKEALSLVYAKAVAARAGYLTSIPGPDRDSIDLRVQAGGSMRPALDLQLKATVNLNGPNDGHFQLPLKLKNYNDLRIPAQTPRLLVVLDLPEDEQQWMTITEDELILRRRAYWLNLREGEATTNRSSVTVRIPATNLFHVESLRALMAQSRKGKIR